MKVCRQGVHPLSPQCASPDPGRRCDRAGPAPDTLSPKREAATRGSEHLQRNCCYWSRFEATQRSAPERRKKARARDQSSMRVVFWLSRASAPLWWDSNVPSNDPLLRRPALMRYSAFNLTNTGSAKSILSGFRVVNTIERNDFGAFEALLERSLAGSNSGTVPPPAPPGRSANGLERDTEKWQFATKAQDSKLHQVCECNRCRLSAPSSLRVLVAMRWFSVAR